MIWVTSSGRISLTGNQIDGRQDVNTANEFDHRYLTGPRGIVNKGLPYMD